MEPLFAALEAAPLALWLRGARWGYAAVNTAHILGLALLIGAIVTLDLRRLGAFASVPLETATRLLTPVAASGLALAIVAGALLFAPRASEYAANPVFVTKVALVAFGAAFALLLHAPHRFRIDRLSPRRRALCAALSLSLWLAVLTLGRLIAFTG